MAAARQISARTLMTYIAPYWSLAAAVAVASTTAREDPQDSITAIAETLASLGTLTETVARRREEEAPTMGPAMVTATLSTMVPSGKAGTLVMDPQESTMEALVEEDTTVEEALLMVAEEAVAPVTVAVQSATVTTTPAVNPGMVTCTLNMSRSTTRA
jgi:hypothetical protein